MNKDTLKTSVDHYRRIRKLALKYLLKYKSTGEEFYSVLYRENKAYADGFRFAIDLTHSIDIRKTKA